MIKELRLRNRDNALYWMLVLIQLDGDSVGAVRLLRMFLIEDCSDVTSLFAALLSKADDLNRNEIENVACRLFDIATSKDTHFFWETKEGRDTERTYWHIHDQVQADIASTSLRHIPDYAIDIHTKVGRGGATPPHIYSGTREGRLNMCEEYEGKGKLGEKL